jgi:hypothetical protein
LLSQGHAEGNRKEREEFAKKARQEFSVEKSAQFDSRHGE